MSRRRILTVLDALPEGDAVEFVLESADRLSRRHFDLRYAFLGEGGALGDALQEKRVRVYQMSLAPRSFWRAAWALHRLVRSTGVDLVHAHEPRAARLSALASWGRCPVLISAHGLPREPGWDGRLGRWALDARHATMTAPSEEARAQWREEAGVEVERVLPPLLDLESLRAGMRAQDRERARTHLGLGPDHFLVANLGTFEPGAGHETLLHAFRLARTERNELRLVLGGEGPRLPDARWLAESLDLEDSVMFLGRVEDRAALLAAADLWVQPGPPYTSLAELLRALVAGLPVLGFDTASLRELAGDDGAVLLESDRPEETARMILELMDDPERRAAVAERGSEAARRWASGSVTERLAGLYSTLAS